MLGRSLDELPPGTRRLLDLLEQLVAAAAGEQGVSRERVSFTRRELREQLGWGDTQLKVHLARLVSLELVHAHRGAHGAVRLRARLGRRQAVDGALLPRADRPRPARCREHAYDLDRSGPGERSVGGWSAPGRRPVGGRSGRPERLGSQQRRAIRAVDVETPQIAVPGASSLVAEPVVTVKPERRAEGRLMPRRGERSPKLIPGDRSDPLGFPVLVEEFLESLAGSRLLAEDG